MVGENDWAVSGQEFEAFVNRHRQRLAVVHFWADWNPLDPRMFEVLQEVHQAIGDEVAMARVQVGPPENRELCRWLGVVQVPTLLFLFRNQILDVKVGYSKQRLLGHVQLLIQACYAAGPERGPTAPTGALPPAPGWIQTPVEPTDQEVPWYSPDGGDFVPGHDPALPPWRTGPDGDTAADFSRRRLFTQPTPSDGSEPAPHEMQSIQTGSMAGMRFGLYPPPQPATVPLANQNHKKSWLSRWLGLE